MDQRSGESTREARIAWWREARFGMFIHWGLYAVPAGEWKGKSYPGIGEWIMFKARIPIAEYERLTDGFDPVEFDAGAWADLTADAGMKYMIITAKHHDGFAMFRSAVSPFNIADATPFGRDPVAELAAACADRGLKFGVYYSQAQDWHEPGAAIWEGRHEDGPDYGAKIWDPRQEGDFDRYLDTKAIPQVRELLTKYGPISIIWFDTPLSVMTDERAAKLEKTVRDLSPDTLISGRLGGDARSDYDSEGDNRIPKGLRPGDWETPATLNDTWGFRKDDENWKSSSDLIFKLVDIVSKGGNYLLNVGPDALGRIPAPSRGILREVGKWMKVNGEAIYGAGATPFGDELVSTSWRCTAKTGTLYIHLFESPGAAFAIDGVEGRVSGVRLLSADPSSVRFTQDGKKLTIDIPASAIRPPATVLRISMER